MSVLAQQWEHQKLGIQDPKGLFQLSKICSKSSRQRALRRAEEDAREAREIAQEPRNTSDIINDVIDLLDGDIYRYL
jgi:hypothetical protein